MNLWWRSALVGALVGLLHAFLSIDLKANHVVSATAINSQFEESRSDALNRSPESTASNQRPGAASAPESGEGRRTSS